MRSSHDHEEETTCERDTGLGTRSKTLKGKENRKQDEMN